MSSITISEYEHAALRTANESILSFSESLGIYSMGLGGEAGEVTDLLKKVVGHKHELSKEVLTKEIGDVLWYLAVLGNRIGVPITSMARVEEFDALYENDFKSFDFDLEPGDKKTILLCLRLSRYVGLVSECVENFILGLPYTNSITVNLPRVLRYLTLIAQDQGISMSEAANVNVQKLLKRYPKGFSPQDSINRVES